MSDLIEIDHSIHIYGIVEGPFHSSEIEDWDEDECWMIVCQVENAFGGIEVEELTFWTFDDAYEVIKYFKDGRPTPFVIECETVFDADEEPPVRH